MIHDRILSVVYSAIDETNKLVSEKERLEKSPDTILYGSGGKLDSLGLVNVIVAIEEEVEKEFKVHVTLADERALSHKPSLFQTIRSMSQYIEILLTEAGLNA